MEDTFAKKIVELRAEVRQKNLSLGVVQQHLDLNSYFYRNLKRDSVAFSDAVASALRHASDAMLIAADLSTTPQTLAWWVVDYVRQVAEHNPKHPSCPILDGEGWRYIMVRQIGEPEIVWLAYLMRQPQLIEIGERIPNFDKLLSVPENREKLEICLAECREAYLESSSAWSTTRVDPAEKFKLDVAAIIAASNKPVVIRTTSSSNDDEFTTAQKAGLVAGGVALGLLAVAGYNYFRHGSFTLVKSSN